jgi:hypothetical protein
MKGKNDKQSEKCETRWKRIRNERKVRFLRVSKRDNNHNGAMDQAMRLKSE